jgi:hypothetical protein
VIQIPSELYEDESGRFLTIDIESTRFYIPESSIPGGFEKQHLLLALLNDEPSHRILERLLTPTELGGLEARINPADEIVFIDDQPIFHSLSFDEEFSIQRRIKKFGFDPYGLIRVNLFLEDSNGFDEKVITVEFECEYPLVAELMSPLHPERSVREFLVAIEDATDAKQIAQAFRSHRIDDSWSIGLPSRSGGVSGDAGSAFLERIVNLDAVDLFSTGDDLLRAVHSAREGKLSIDTWVDEHLSQLSEEGLENALAVDLGL